MKWIATLGVLVATGFVVAAEWTHVHVWLLRERAEERYYRGDFEGTIAIYDRVIEKRPDDPLSYTDAADTISQFLAGPGQQLDEAAFELWTERALRDYLQALDAGPPSSWTFARVAALADSLRRRREADGGTDLARLFGDLSALTPEDRLEEAAWLKAVSIEPRNFYYRDFLGDYYLRRGFRDRATEQIRYSVRLHPILSEHYYLSDYAELSDDVIEAVVAGVQDALAAEDTRVTQFKIHQSMADMFTRLGRWNDALASIDASAEFAEHEHHIDVQRGILFVRMGSDSAAIDSFRGAAEKQPGYFRAWLHLAMALSRTGEHEAAVDAAYRANGLNPRDYSAATTLAQVLDAADRHDEAAAALERLIRRHPERPQSYTRLIDLYMRMGQRENAIRVAREISERYPEEQAYKNQLDQLERGTGGL